jgi:hypothetical protein
MSRVTRSRFPPQDKNVSFSVSIGYKDVERIKTLLKEGVDPSYDNNEAIGRAPQGDIFSSSKTVDPRSAELVKLLLSDSRVDPSANDNVALYYAVKANDIESVKLLINDKRFKITPGLQKILKYNVAPKGTESYKLIQNILETGKTPWDRKEELGAAEINKQKRYEIQEGLEKRGVPSSSGTGPLNKILDFANIPRPAKGTGRRRRKMRKNGKTRRR